MRDFKKQTFGNTNNRQRSGRRNSRRDEMRKTEFHTVTCDSCGKSCEVPFKPRSDKPVYCDTCFKKDAGKGQRSDNSEQLNSKLDLILRELAEIKKITQGLRK